MARPPTDWEQSFIFCLYKGKGDALDKSNYRGLKLAKQGMKILERNVLSIEDSQFGFVPGRDTTDAISAGEIPSSEQEALWKEGVERQRSQSVVQACMTSYRVQANTQ